MSNHDDDFKLPKFMSWDIIKLYDYENNIIDYEDLQRLDEAIKKTRLALFKATEKINSIERREKLAKTEYMRAYRREYLKSTEKTETAKKARAELKCEELENTWLVMDQVKNEVLRLSYTLKQELQILQTISNNMRQQLKI